MFRITATHKVRGEGEEVSSPAVSDSPGLSLYPPLRLTCRLCFAHGSHVPSLMTLSPVPQTGLLPQPCLPTALSTWKEESFDTKDSQVSADQ